MDAELRTMGHIAWREISDRRANFYSRHWLLTSANAVYSAGARSRLVRCWTADLCPLTAIMVPPPSPDGHVGQYDQGILQISAGRDGNQRDVLYITLAGELQMWRVTLAGTTTLARRLTASCWTGRILRSLGSDRILVMGMLAPQSSMEDSSLVLVDLEDRDSPSTLDRVPGAFRPQVQPVHARGPVVLHHGQVGWIQWAQGGMQELRIRDLANPGTPSALTTSCKAEAKQRLPPIREICAIQLPLAWEYEALRDILCWGRGED